MDLFDVNCFVGRWTTEGHGCNDLAGLANEMSRLGVGRALVRHTWGWEYDPRQGNELLARELAGAPHLRPCLAATPLLDEELGGLDAFLRSLREANAGAVCIYPRSHSYSLAPWCCGPLLDAVQAMRLPLLLETAESNWPEVQSVLSNWPSLPLVLTNTGYRILRQLLPLMRAHDNLHIDISYLADNEAIETLDAAVGVERILFGSGTPRVDGGGAVARLAYSTICDAKKELIAHGNLERLIAAADLGAGAVA